jgi:hypothetical protein
MKKQVVLHSGLAPAAAVDALRRCMDEEQWTLFSLTGYKGDQPVLGVITGNSFRLQKRRHWRNDFAPHFYGQMVLEPGGTRIEGHFDLSEWVRGFMWVWLGMAAMIGIPIFAVTLFHFLKGTQAENDAVGLIVPPTMIAWGFVLPRIGRLMGRSDEAFILQHLENCLSARIEPAPALTAKIE